MPAPQARLVQGFYFRPEWVYDPADHGPIDSISYSLDVRSLGVGMGLALKQGGCIYSGGSYFTEYRGFWVSTPGVQYPNPSGFSNLKGTDFPFTMSLGGTARPHADFSMGAEPIVFGYVSANSTAWGSSGYVSSADLDNLSITVVPKVFAASNRALADPLVARMSHLTFRTWGMVMVVDEHTLTLCDGSGKPITVIAPGHPVLENGDFTVATGRVTQAPFGTKLTCEGSDVFRVERTNP